MPGFDGNEGHKEKHRYSRYVGKWVVVGLQGATVCGKVESVDIEEMLLSPFVSNESVLRYDLKKEDYKEFPHYRIVNEDEGPFSIPVRCMQGIRPIPEAWARSHVEATKDSPKL